MGFEKWIYRNGFGSPGHTARTLVKWYRQLKNANDFIEEEDVYFSIYQMRLQAHMKINTPGSLLEIYLQKISQIIDENDMPLFVFAIETLESSQFRSGISDKNIDLVLEVIREEVEKLDGTLISLTYNDYRDKAIDFFNRAYEYAQSR